MLRFCGKKYAKSEYLDSVILDERVLINEDLWQNQKTYFRRMKMEAHRPSVLALLPIVDANRNIVCYGWQDEEANRELRMLKELEKSATALQFRDIFPEVREVLICGCNELAFYFAKYLECQQIKVSVAGKYWDFFGYKSTGEIEPDDGERMVIQAEHILGTTGDLYQKLIRSASLEFECIDMIYEANVKDERITNAGGGIEWLLKKLEGKDVFLSGNSTCEQDAYDWLYAHGIDISGFIFGGEDWYGASYLLGKKRVSMDEVVKCGRGGSNQLC